MTPTDGQRLKSVRVYERAMRGNDMNSPVALLISSLLAFSSFGSATVLAQDMMGLDVTSDAFTKSEMTRTDIERALADLAPGAVLDLSGRSLNGLDLSGLDLRRTKLQSARINKVNLKGANLEGVVLDQAWSLNSDLTGANLKGASLFSTQFGGSKLDNADFTKARVAGDFTNANMTKAILAQTSRPMKKSIHGSHARRLQRRQARRRVLQRSEHGADLDGICFFA